MICNDFYYHIRDGANTGFHEAIGELMAMASSTPRHLFDVGLMSELVEDDQVRAMQAISRASGTGEGSRVNL